MESNHPACRTNTVHKPRSYLLPHVCPSFRAVRQRHHALGWLSQPQLQHRGLGWIVQDFLPHPTSCVPMILHLARLGIEPSPLADSNHAAHGYHRQMDYAVSTENWRGMPESNQHLRRGKKRKALQLAPYNNAACAPVFPGCHFLFFVYRVALRKSLTLSLGAACRNRTDTTR